MFNKKIGVSFLLMTMAIFARAQTVAPSEKPPETFWDATLQKLKEADDLTDYTADTTTEDEKKIRQKFFDAVHQIVDSGDLSNYKFIAEKLGLKVTALPEKIVYFSPGHKIGGRKIDIQFIQDEWKIFGFLPKKKFDAGMFQLDGKKFRRTWFGIDIDPQKFCATKADFYKTFDNQIQQGFATNLGGVPFFHEVKKNNWISVGTSFDKRNCMTGIGFSQNMERDED